MTAPVRTIDTLARVEADLNYLAPMAERPRNYTFDPPPGVPRSNTAASRRTGCPCYDVRPIASEITLDREGFALVDTAQRGARLLR